MMIDDMPNETQTVATATDRLIEPINARPYSGPQADEAPLHRLFRSKAWGNRTFKNTLKPGWDR